MIQSSVFCIFFARFFLYFFSCDSAS